MDSEFESRLRQVAVLPVATLSDAGSAVPLARALAAGGIDMIEIALRTDAAAETIRRVAAEVPETLVGAGTVVVPADVERAVEAGARFLVAPGATTRLLDAAADAGVPFLPGAASPSEAMALAERGYTTLKFFPAEPAGGVAALNAIAGPLPGLGFVPTGGIDAARAADYVRLPNVVCVGGSWLAPGEAVRAGDWDRITGLARDAAALRRIG